MDKHPTFNFDETEGIPKWTTRVDYTSGHPLLYLQFLQPSAEVTTIFLNVDKSFVEKSPWQGNSRVPGNPSKHMGIAFIWRI